MTLLSRRQALGTVALGCAGLALAARARDHRRPLFSISLAQWSLHRVLKSGAMNNLDFPAAARQDFGLDAVEFVNQFFKDPSPPYIASLRQRCDDAGVSALLIMCDGVGALGDPDPHARARAVEAHRPWLDAAAALGCHAIRVNAESRGSYDEQQALAADGLRRLCELADPLNLSVIVENHGGLSSNGRWLAETLRRVDHPRAGSLPDFGNFDPREYDRYQGVQDLMPFARAVSAKSYDFDPAGDETTIDYPRMLRIVLASGYRGHIGVEYEGERLPEPDGIRATIRLLERLRAELETP